jgi:UDP-N-acetylmuramoyl-tripeptide--D-alanyl-D-alanine ligase
MPVPLRVLTWMLKQLALLKLTRENPEIIVVTGSVGKTTTKEAIYTVLSAAFGDRVTRSAGNLNTEVGVPLSLLGFTVVPTRWQYPFVLMTAVGRAVFATRRRQLLHIQEMDADRPGDIRYLVSWLAPWIRVGVVTTVGPIHLDPGQFSSVEQAAKENRALVECLLPSGWAVLNKDNPYTKAMGRHTKAKVKWFADRGVETAFEAAKAVGSIFRVPEGRARMALSSFERPYGRLHELTGIKDTRIIDDSYNANPMSMEQALAILTAKSGRRIAVLGDMLELGVREKVYHQRIGKLARENADVIVGVGKRAIWFAPTYHFASPHQAASFLKKFVRPQDVVLVKGSQSMRMEIVSEALLANKEETDKLPRQSAAWKHKPFVQP